MAIQIQNGYICTYEAFAMDHISVTYCIFACLGREHENIFTYPLSEGARSRLLSWAAFAFLFIFYGLMVVLVRR